jgi:hypothetical protein
MATARNFIDDLAARGQYSFAPEELMETLALSPAAAKAALNR